MGYFLCFTKQSGETMLKEETLRLLPPYLSIRDRHCQTAHKTFVLPQNLVLVATVVSKDLLQLSNRRDGVVVRASASQSIDLGFIFLVESYQKTLKNGIRSFPAGRSA